MENSQEEAKVQVLVTYDVTINQQLMKANLLKRGYSDSWQVNQEHQTLPNTTLWKNETTPKQALQDLKDAAFAAGTKLERAVAVGMKGIAGIPGDSHSRRY